MICLNPFEIRASVQRKQSPIIYFLVVSIPLKSGHRFNYLAIEPLARRAVSIPLKSGHRFNLADIVTKALASRLNPFEIRASVQL